MTAAMKPEVLAALERFENDNLDHAPGSATYAADRRALMTIRKALEDGARLDAFVNSPQVLDFLEGVKSEAAHQVEKWGDAHDRGKSAENWFWLVGYLAGKALRAAITGDKFKAKHHTISSAAALYNWHTAISKDETGCGIGMDNDLKPVEIARFEDGATA